MRCYFYPQQSHFLDNIDHPVLDGAVIYEGDIQFWYSEREGKDTEVLDNPKRNIFLTISRDHEFLLSHRNTMFHTSIEPRRSNHNYVESPSSSTKAHMWLPSSNPSDPLHPKHYERKRDAQVENVI